MRILHINQSDTSGGAAIACDRLHAGLIKSSIDSRILVGEKKSTHQATISLPRIRYIEKLAYTLSHPLGLNYLNTFSSFFIPHHDFYKKTDALIFHNLHQGQFGYFNYLSIPFLTQPKPAIFLLHDMWAFTGHCAYSFDCTRWQTGCGQCPYPDTYPAITTDNTHLEWKLKRWSYQKANLTIVTPSQWLADQAKKSILNHLPIHHIPNGLDTDVYKPKDQHYCRQQLGLPIDKHIIMFGAASLSDSRKGSDLLTKALIRLPPSIKQNSILLTFGNSQSTADSLDISTVQLGYLHSDDQKAVAYSAADIFVFPTRADNLPLVLQESMACGTPMVSFNIGGVPELVRPNITGLLAPPENVDALSHAIAQLLTTPDILKKMRHHCRRIAQQEYSVELQVQRYIALMQDIL